MERREINETKRFEQRSKIDVEMMSIYLKRIQGKMMETDESKYDKNIGLANITFDIERPSRLVQTIYQMILSLQSKRFMVVAVLPLTSEPFCFDPFDNVDVVQIKWPQSIQTTRTFR